MKPLSRLIALGLAAVSFASSGCGLDQYPAYSPTIKYGVRQDPILRDASKNLGDERFDPDGPGQFPIMKFDDIFKPDNPLYLKSAEIKSKEVLRDPTKMSAKDRDELEKTLEAAFGTPAKPSVNPKESGVDASAIAALKLDDDTLAKGSTRYRIHCLHCHGVPGDGRGPTARWINPHPRDFRQGLFKFQSVNQSDGSINRPPTRADLLRTLRSGIEGTAMPSFALLDDQELDWIISYVIHLSIRGTAEFNTIKESFNAKDGNLNWVAEENIPETVKAYAQLAASKWKESPDRAITVAPYPWPANDMEKLAESVKRGQQLFTGKPEHPRGKNANCVSCHTDIGRQAKFRYDDWGTLVKPNNFTLGVFRGGKRPIDLYYRIHSGINGSGMTPFGSPTTLQTNDIWDLVNFVSNVSYPGMRENLKIKIN